MPTENYQIHNIHQYKRKTYKNENSVEGYANGRVNENDVTDSPRTTRSDRVSVDEAGCSCDIDSDGEVANILHKKCAVIALAQQQLQRILDERDKALCDHVHSFRSMYDLLNICKTIILKHNKCGCILISLMFIALLVGLVFGSATCGTTLRGFNSPILTCIDNLFISGPSTVRDSFRGII